MNIRNYEGRHGDILSNHFGLKLKKQFPFRRVEGGTELLAPQNTGFRKGSRARWNRMNGQQIKSCVSSSARITVLRLKMLFGVLIIHR